MGYLGLTVALEAFASFGISNNRTAWLSKDSQSLVERFSRWWQSSQQESQHGAWWLRQLGYARSRSTKNSSLLLPLPSGKSGWVLPVGWRSFSREASPLEPSEAAVERMVIPTSSDDPGQVIISERGSTPAQLQGLLDLRVCCLPYSQSSA